jgi:transcriptional regulator with XRE-family HTH domain
MKDLLGQIENRRLALGLSQGAVASRLSISQPHYSKIVRGIVPVTPAMAEALTAWLNSTGRPASTAENRRSARIQKLTRSIERQLQELNSILIEDGIVHRRRAPRQTREH